VLVHPWLCLTPHEHIPDPAKTPRHRTIRPSTRAVGVVCNVRCDAHAVSALPFQKSPPQTYIYAVEHSLITGKQGKETEKHMAAAAVKSSAGMAGKKSRKPYVVSRPREKWTADEHGRFLHALLLFGRDWKRVQAFVATKTGTQIRSHAQKHFLRADKKLGLAVPPRHPHRSAAGCPAWCADDGGTLAPDVETVQFPLSPDDLRLAQVYRFVGDVLGSSVEAQLHRLLGADPVVVDTVLRVLANLQDNLDIL
jgi:SHAQKYF class myb-like DNA-binding protein